jgi:hypothetical protein
MNRLVAVLLLMPFSAFADDCPPPALGSNVVCLDPTGPTETTPTKRSRTFGMNGRTMEAGTPNIFWVQEGQWSVGNFGGPELTIIEYSAPGNPLNTQWELAISGSYGKQQQFAGGGGTYYFWFRLLDANLQPMDVPTGLTGIYLRCSDFGAQKRHSSDPLQNRDGSLWNLLDAIQAIELSASGGGQNWTAC